MKSQLQRILQNKNSLSKRLNKIKNEILAEIYKGTLHNYNVNKIQKDIQKIIKSYGVPLYLAKPLYLYSIKLTKKAKQIDDSALLLPLAIYNLFKKDDSYHKMKSISYEVAKKYEADEKEQTIENEIKHNRTLENPKIFYLCSHHQDCAVDHLHYQARLYYDEDWENFVTDENLKKAIKIFIRQHNMASFQWVTHRPVWLITRPHCRHYFKALTVTEAMGQSINGLLLKNKMTHTIGQRPTQAIAHSTKKSWYTKVNIEGIIEKYKDRLEFHKALYDVQKLDILKSAITKDKFLIQKWQKFLTSQQF